MSCDIQDPFERETMFSQILNTNANPADDVAITVSTDGVTYTPAQVVDLNCNPAPNTGNLFAFPGSGQYITGLTPATHYFIKWSILPGSPDPAEDLVCQYDAPGFPVFTCIPEQIGSTGVEIFEGASGGLADLGFCKQDFWTLQYGKTGQGFPFAVNGIFNAPSQIVNLSGLTPDTDYSVIFSAFAQGAVTPYFISNPPCTFHTRPVSCGRNVGVLDTFIELPNHNGNLPGTVKQFYPPGTGSTV